MAPFSPTNTSPPARVVLAHTPQAGERTGDIRCQGHHARLAGLWGRQRAVGVVRPHPQESTIKVDVPPAQRKQLSHPQARERRGQEDRRVLLVCRRPNERPHLARREHLDVEGTAQPRLLDAAHRVHRQTVELLRTIENPTQQNKRLCAGTGLPRHRGEPALDVSPSQLLELHLSESRTDLPVDQPPVALHGRGLTFAIVLDVAQILIRRISHCHSGPYELVQGASAGFVQRVPQPRLGEPLREIPDSGPPALRPRRSQLALHLAAVRQPVLGVPNGAALAVGAKYVAARRRSPHASRSRVFVPVCPSESGAVAHASSSDVAPFPGHIRDIVTFRKYAAPTKTSHLQAL
jgi:hypothetical protein